MGLMSSAIEIGTGGLIDPDAGPEAAGNAAAAQAQALNRAINLQRDIYEQGRRDLSPYRAVGGQALNSLSSLFLPGGSERSQLEQQRKELIDQVLRGDHPDQRALQKKVISQFGLDTAESDIDFSGIDDSQIMAFQRPEERQIFRDLRGIDRQLAEMGSIEENPQAGQQNALNQFFQSPGYQFRMDQGTQAIERSNAARGRLDSGATLQDLTQFGQGLASQEFNNYANRLASLAGVGQSATNAGVSQGQNFASQQGNLLGQLGNARASGYVGAFNADPLSANSLMGFGSNLLGGLLAGG